MIKSILQTFLLAVTCWPISHCFGQNPAYSESIIKYDLQNGPDKPIPFDHSFTLVVEKLSTKNLVRVDVYEATYHRGKRDPVFNSFRNCANTRVSMPVRDMTLRTNPYSDTLQIFFPPVRPNCYFDVYAVYGLTKEALDNLMELNAKTAQNNGITDTTAFKKFLRSTVNTLYYYTASGMTTISAYSRFFNTLSTHYGILSSPGNYQLGAVIPEDEIKALDISTSRQGYDFRDDSYLLEVSRQGKFADILSGCLDIKKVFDADAVVDMNFCHKRLENFESNKKYFDSLLARIDRSISKGETTATVSGVAISLNTVRTDIVTMITGMRANIHYLSYEMNFISTAIDTNPDLRTSVFLSGTTAAADLKTSGGNVLFIDAGLANILAPGLDGKATYIPKLYTGISIYFRAIDKNTRRNRFPNKFNPTRYYGCHTDTVVSPSGIVQLLDRYGPDYGVASRWSIKQHLSLNIGITWGSMANKDFDNFYNNTSLLVGPAYRFARAFKVSAGVAFLKRTSKDPLISDKKIVPGGYLSLSADIDFIQGLKDITSTFFK